MKIFKFISLATSVFYLIKPSFVLAATLIPRSDFSGRYRNLFNAPTVYPTDVLTVAERIAGFLIFAAEIVVAIIVVWAGIKYMSAGSDEKKVTDAKAILKNGLIGALILFGVGVILNTVAEIAFDPTAYF